MTNKLQYIHSSVSKVRRVSMTPQQRRHVQNYGTSINSEVHVYVIEKKIKMLHVQSGIYWLSGDIRARHYWYTSLQLVGNY